MTTRPCPDCGKPTRPYGAPRTMPSGFIDQIVVCPKCGWNGVITEWPQPGRKQEPRQLALFELKG